MTFTKEEKAILLEIIEQRKFLLSEDNNEEIFTFGKVSEDRMPLLKKLTKIEEKLIK